MFRITDNVIEITRGDSSPDIKIEIMNNAGELYELQEGDVLEFTVKKNTTARDSLIQKTGGIFALMPDDTSNLKYGSYVYDVQLTLSDGRVETIIEPSEFIVAPEVTF